MRKFSQNQQKSLHSQSYKRSGSGGLLERQAVISKILGDSLSQQQVGRTPRYQQSPKNQPYLRINRHQSNSFERKRQSRLILKPILADQLAYKIKGNPSPRAADQAFGKSSKVEVLEETGVEQLFYRQVRIQQEFKNLSKLVG